MGSNKDIEAVPLRIAKAQPDLAKDEPSVPPSQDTQAPARGPGAWQHLMARLDSSRRLKNSKH